MYTKLLCLHCHFDSAHQNLIDILSGLGIVIFKSWLTCEGFDLVNECHIIISKLIITGVSCCFKK